jgi:predicted hydrocarbon binding protein
MFHELSRYADGRQGPGAWTAIRQAAGLPSDFFLITDDYPDDDFMSLCGQAASRTGQSLEALLEDFGTFLVPGLLSIYGSLVEPKWDVLSFLEHTEDVIHRAVRIAHPEARPPALKVLRTDEEEVTVIYRSPRQLCALACGIIAGVAQHYEAPVRIRQDTCMHRGDPECRIRVAIA